MNIHRLTTWLNTGDNSFGVFCICLAPLFAAVAIGVMGS